jgi:hypothetical protein
MPGPSIPAADFVRQRARPGPKGQKNLGKTGGNPPIRDFLLKIRSRFGDRFLRFFGIFRQKAQKRAEKFGLSSSSSELAGEKHGERVEDRGPGIEARGSRGAVRPLLTRFRRTKGRLSSSSRPVAVS